MILQAARPRGHGLRPAGGALPQLGPPRGDRRALRLDEDDEPRGGGRRARALRPHPRGRRASRRSSSRRWRCSRKNGVLAWSPSPAGDRKIEVPADRINQGFVLGNKVAVGSVNASREDFEQGVADLAQAELVASRLAREAADAPGQGPRELPRAARPPDLRRTGSSRPTAKSRPCREPRRRRGGRPGCRGRVPADRAVLVAISGIDASGKGYVAARLAERLVAAGLRVALTGVQRLAESSGRALRATHGRTQAVERDTQSIQPECRPIDHGARAQQRQSISSARFARP